MRAYGKSKDVERRTETDRQTDRRTDRERERKREREGDSSSATEIYWTSNFWNQHFAVP
jgi:hypothetical protein